MSQIGPFPQIGVKKNVSNQQPDFSWWLNQPHLKNMLVILEFFPKVWGENKRT